MFYVLKNARCLPGKIPLLISVAALAAPAVHVAPPTRYVQHNLVSDGFVPADVIDPNLVNPWGIAPNPTGVWWVSDNQTGVSSLYNQVGYINTLLVNIPGADGSPDGGRPTAIVFSGGNDFVISDGVNSGPARFIFASEDGTISAWNPVVPPPPPSTQAHPIIDDSDECAIYKGLPLASTSDGNRLYTTDFHNGSVDIYDGNFDEIEIEGAFEDDQIPAGFAPFGIAAINGNIYVSYAMQDEDGEDDVAGKGLGYVDVYDTDGNLLQRLISKGRLNAPWGMVQAPADFGEFSNALLVGNFGDGRINAYDIVTGKFLGSLKSSPGHPIEIEGLWGLAFGTGIGSNGATNELFFAAGPDDEEHGLFGSISVGSSQHGHDDEQ